MEQEPSIHITGCKNSLVIDKLATYPSANKSLALFGSICCVFQQVFGCCAPKSWSKFIKYTAKHRNIFENQLILWKFHRNNIGLTVGKL